MIQALMQAATARATALLTRAGAVLPELAVEDFPGRPEAYRLSHPKGALLLAYSGSDYGAPGAGGAQARLMKLDFVLQIRNLAKHQGAYEVLEHLRVGFTGWEAPGCLAAYPTREAFRGAEDGVYQYVLTLACPTRVAPLQDLPAALPGALDLTLQTP